MKKHHDWAIENIASEGSGITTSLSEQVNMLGSLLGQATKHLSGKEIYNHVETLRSLCKEARLTSDSEKQNEVTNYLKNLDLPTLNKVLRSFTVYFHLVNEAEQNEIVRINREREFKNRYRKESIGDGITSLKKQGFSFQEVVSVLDKINIEPTFTAHPTEARRRSILLKQRTIARVLNRFTWNKLTPDEIEESYSQIYQFISLMLVTDEVRTEKLTVRDEVQNGLYFVQNSIWNIVPDLYRDVDAALRDNYGKSVELKPIIKFRSWIGGDRDGNPFVTADVTRITLQQHKIALLDLYLYELNELRRELSLSNQLTDLGSFNLYEVDDHLAPPNEPVRSSIIGMANRVKEHLTGENSSYSVELFLADLFSIKEKLIDSGLIETANYGRLTDLIYRVKTFGFNLLSLDVRQHSAVHETALTELFKNAAIVDDYSALDESEKLKLLVEELSHSRPLLQPRAEITDVTREVLDVFELIAEAKSNDKDSVGAYIISMTHSISDILEVLILAKEVGLYTIHNGKVESNIDVVPLLETIEDLENGKPLLEELFNNATYKKQLHARNQFQEIMLGYSDSNKDGGYWMANWALHKAQREISETCKAFNIDHRLFHGRGGTVGRGGGRANRAITSLPVSTHNGRIRMTEQGEVITFRYALPQIAHRHLEQIINAVIVSTANSKKKQEDNKTYQKRYEIMEKIAKESMQAYRSMILDDSFWDYYSEVTPIRHISRLKIASRPVSRSKSKTVDLASIRAIPWNFAWTQTRYNVPGWFGVGTALHEIITDKELLTLLQEWYNEWPFFQAVIQNSERELSRAELSMSEKYAQRAMSKYDLKNFHNIIADEYKRSVDGILAITNQDKLLSRNIVIQRSIEIRNPYTDVINLIQIELLNRWESVQESETDPLLGKTILLSINGLAAAMQSTG